MAMESLRQPLEDGRVTITRVGATLSYPCSLMLVAAMNPCPCGYFGHPSRECHLLPRPRPPATWPRVSGPLLDRIDLHIEVPPVQFDELAARKPGETRPPSGNGSTPPGGAATAVRRTGIGSNARIPAGSCGPTARCRARRRGCCGRPSERLGLSARGYDRVLKVARTIADLDGGGDISRPRGGSRPVPKPRPEILGKPIGPPGT